MHSELTHNMNKFHNRLMKLQCQKKKKKKANIFIYILTWDIFDHYAYDSLN